MKHHCPQPYDHMWDCQCGDCGYGTVWVCLDHQIGPRTVTKRSKDGKAALIKYPVTDQMKFILERAESYLEKMKQFP